MPTHNPYAYTASRNVASYDALGLGHTLERLQGGGHPDFRAPVPAAERGLLSQVVLGKVRFSATSGDVGQLVQAAAPQVQVLDLECVTRNGRPTGVWRVWVRTAAQAGELRAALHGAALMVHGGAYVARTRWQREQLQAFCRVRNELFADELRQSGLPRGTVTAQEPATEYRGGGGGGGTAAAAARRQRA